MKKVDQRGVVDLAFVVALVVLVAAASFTFWKINQTDETVSDTANNTASDSSLTTSEGNAGELLEEYSNAEYDFSFEYPADWQLTDSTTSPENGNTSRVSLSIVAPDGTEVIVRADTGGYGGYCEAADGDAPHTTTAACATSEYLSSEKLSIKNQQSDLTTNETHDADVYLVDRKYTSVGDDGRTIFQKALFSDTQPPKLNDPVMGNYYPFTSFRVDNNSGADFHLYFYSDFMKKDDLDSTSAKAVEDMFKSLIINL